MCFCSRILVYFFFFFFQAEDGIRDRLVTGVQTCALPIFDESHPTIPLSCSLCGFLFKGMEDIIMFKRYGVCSECGLRWAQCRELDRKSVV